MTYCYILLLLTAIVFCLLVFVTVKLTRRGSLVKQRLPACIEVTKEKPTVCLPEVCICACKTLLQDCSSKMWYSCSRVNIIDDCTCHDHHNFTAINVQNCIGLHCLFSQVVNKYNWQCEVQFIRAYLRIHDHWKL